MKIHRLLVAPLALLAVASGPALAHRPRVRRVCNGSTSPCPHGGHHKTIAGAVKRAKPGDWILIWPGVYHEKGDPAGVYVTKANLHIRGMDRNLVIVDGSNGTAAAPCPSDAASQDFTPRNGIE